MYNQQVEQKATSYRAVDGYELRRTLGSMCSPDSSRGFYVIGPDLSGRLCHVASCSSMKAAKDYAAELNNRFAVISVG